jgi:hypothetical protein
MMLMIINIIPIKHLKVYYILAATTGAKQPNGMLWGIFDSNIRDELTYQAPNHAVFDYTDPAEIEKLEHSLAAANKTKGNAAQIKDKAGAVREESVHVPNLSDR